MKDSAKGPSSGYIYQFEIGLLQLTKLNQGEAISIEHVDDVAVLDSKGMLLVVFGLSFGAKTSII